MNPLHTYLSSIAVATPASHGNLTMVPLLAPQAAAPAYLLLDEALQNALADVTEVSEAGAVPELLFRNRAEHDVLLVDGEELVGAKQNRVLNLTILAPARSELRIPVSCVEAGRWAWRSRKFAPGLKKLHARARAKKMRGVTAALRESGARARGDIQAGVWDEVDSKLAAFKVWSASSALHDALEAVAPDLEAIRARFAPQPQQVGAAFFIGAKLVGLDVFDAPQAFAKLLPKLVESYAFDALEKPSAKEASPSLEEVRALLARIAQAPAETYPAVGKGTDLRIDTPQFSAAALLERERIVHLAAFAVQEERDEVA